MTWALLVVAHYSIAVALIVRVLRQRKEPLVMVAWILAILAVPVLGMLLYALLSPNRIRRKASRRRRRVAHLINQLRRWAEEHALAEQPTADGRLPEDLAGIEQLGRRLVDMPATGGNALQVFSQGRETFAALEASIEGAQRHVHLEYYIWRPDETGRHLRDVVVKCAERGVECRLLLDAVGCWQLGREFLRPLVRAGAQVAFFLPLYPFRRRRRWSLHLRNHRKIAVIDGQVAFVGSQNVGDEYQGRHPQLSPWYDTQLRIEGPAVLFVQQAFAEDWYLAAREGLDSDRYFPPPQRPGEALVQVLPTGPDHSSHTLTQMFFAAVASAKSNIHIATPYFVPDLAARMALEHACYRGVDVRLVVPTCSDIPLALWAGRSFYAELLEAGVQIFEFEAGVLHSKLMSVDDRWALVGSANLDARSFRLNFEVTCVLYDAVHAAEISADITGFCNRGRRITLHEVHRRSWRRQVGEGAARLLAPLL